MIRQNLRISLISLRTNPLRSFLTMSGIIIGITAVITVISIGKGHEEKIEDKIRQLGEDVFWAELDNSFHFNGYQDSKTQYGLATYISGSLSLSDAKAIKTCCSALQWSAPLITTFSGGIINGKSMQTRIIATIPEYKKVRSILLLTGRYLIDDDLFHQNEICVVEENPEIKLAPFQQNYVTVASRVFKIIGVIKTGNSGSMPGNVLTIHIPINVAQTKILGSTSIHSIYCKAKENRFEVAKQQVKNVIYSQHSGKIKLVMRSNRDIFKTQETLTRTVTMVSTGIGMLSLFVGGIGIMNILLSSVIERIKEIGIRRSIGARKIDIWLQLLFESIAFSLVGGVIGIIFGLFTTRIISEAVEVPTVYSLAAIFISLGISIITGIMFGIYPAWKASRLDPIESLRYE